MIDRLAYVYTPSKTSDGEGGWTYSVSDPERVFIALAYHVDRTEAHVRNGSVTLELEDVIEVEGEYYTVKAKRACNVGGYYLVDLVKRDKPVGL